MIKKHIMYYTDSLGNFLDQPKCIFWLDNDCCYHRTNGPADIHYDRSGRIKKEIYIIHNKLHRVDGPAIIRYFIFGFSIKEYYLNNIKYKNLSDLKKAVKISNIE